MWGTYVVFRLTRLYQHVWTLHIRLYVHLGCEQSFEIDLVSHLQYPHCAVEISLVFTECARFGGIGHAALDPHRLLPTIIEIRHIFLQRLECVKER